ncbi:liprin-beta-1-like isoform X2 [Sinocyclocheilus anshuiensis]|uniref:Liprin-beta-1-like n=2 Tax=Sinocyclocheilus anshuiensis TaxID=1608454 RepID=A0A671QY84_9TELE|nr:PREDICTED: liprin-beta-1-like isoform X2 [Sinocyclocheilus anshuiensis]
MMCDASEMLAAALEQMDGIIAGSKAMNYTNGLFDCQSPTSPFLGSLRVLHLLEDLRAALDLMDPEEKESLRSQVSETTAEGLMEWLQSRLTNGHGSAAGDLVYQERLSRLESDKECLVLQVSVLTDQVEVQGEKIRDLDSSLEEHRMKLNATEELLQQELLSRSALETEKLELLTEVSSLKLKLAAAEGDCRESEGLYHDVKDMRLQLTSMEDERQEYERCLNSSKVQVPHGQEELLSLQKQLEESEQALRRLQDQAMSEAPNTERSQSREKDMEVKRMRSAVESLKAANEEKDLKIKELQQSLIRFKGVQDMVMSVQASKDKPRDEDTREGLCDTEMVSTEETDEPQLIPCSELLPEVTTHKPAAETTDSVSEVQQPERSRLTSNNEDETSKNGGSPSISPTQPSSGGNESFGSKKTRSSFGRGFFKIRGNKMTSTAPNLIEGERKGTEHLDLAGVQTQKPKALERHSPEGKKKSKGIMKLFGRMKRSQSTSDDLDDSPESAFSRGGVRATAGPRLGWSRDLQRSNNNELDSPFSRWSKEQVCEWLQNQGLDLYVNQAQQWISSGQTLLKASQHDLEKDMGIRHPLHRKKLQLALQSLGSEEDDAMGKLDYNWVTRWLDDIGLPQYKSQFDESRVDGRMLHYMTVDDLLGLKVGSVLHHLSMKRAIQVLRINCYDPSCLRRRPTENNPTPAEICQWTNHRVMEWLRSVDLAEYAPNLRGSGVHGGLMVLEPRFNVETMALLLNIPPNKTLLRRHLATNFHLLIGSEAQRLKQEYLENSDYTVLTATAKVKPRRLSFGSFGTLRRKRQEEMEEYVCPMDVQMPQSSSFNKGLCAYEDSLDQLEQMEDSEGTVRQIGAFSEGINNLTSMLKEDEFFMEASSHSPETSTIDDD